MLLCHTQSTDTAQFPVSWFDRYYNDPSNPITQPQPVITNPITKTVYPLNLTAPDQVPVNNLRDPITLPPIYLRGEEARLLAHRTLSQVIRVIRSNSTKSSSCEKCTQSLDLMGKLARRAPQLVPEALVSLCETYRFNSRCQQQYGLHSMGPIAAQVLAFADLTGYDGQYICFNFFSKISKCPLPSASPLDISKYIKSTKPRDATSRRRTKSKETDRMVSSTDQKRYLFPKSKERLRVLHISDFHLDPRYATNSEAECSSNGMCCRIPSPNNLTESAQNQIKYPAPRFGYYRCDSPLALGMAAVQAIPVLTGLRASKKSFDFTVYTGDLVAHDQTYDWKKHLGGGPIYAAIGNHDSHLQAQDAPHLLMPERLSKQFSWNYEHFSRLWLHNKWIDEDVAKISRAHYGGYSVERYQDLKIITLNTDMWYRANLFNYINMTNPDDSGMLQFLIDELEKSEKQGQSVWIVGHVLSGWDGTNPLINPTNLFYQIVDRFSPHVIKSILWGHTHEDQFQIYYTKNATNITKENAIANAWIGPSITPLTNVNSGFRMYEVDPESYEILDAHTWYADIEETAKTSSMDGNIGPVYKYEYSTREAYGAGIKGWKDTDPLNSTWWHLVTENMLDEIDRRNGTKLLMEKFTRYQGKSSIKTKEICNTKDCIESKVCYMRSGSAPIGRRCKQGYGSVQS
ncbi:Metallo-dependent phosphatase-like protein [Phakopsora pachyrhizi]|uniref:Metallo-dependent phosphatase-like protein n=1 Tax=Phakopsora pachyrhizi TaxID=170000 RepID=A0AAV0AJ90_PHAPC|nr:Metallo-dependent phosphatase-like protein [Phakopsora pachyrhizi]